MDESYKPRLWRALVVVVVSAAFVSGCKALDGGPNITRVEHTFRVTFPPACQGEKYCIEPTTQDDELFSGGSAWLKVPNDPKIQHVIRWVSNADFRIAFKRILPTPDGRPGLRLGKELGNGKLEDAMAVGADFVYELELSRRTGSAAEKVAAEYKIKSTSSPAELDPTVIVDR